MLGCIPRRGLAGPYSMNAHSAGRCALFPSGEIIPVYMARGQTTRVNSGFKAMGFGSS